MAARETPGGIQGRLDELVSWITHHSQLDSVATACGMSREAADHLISTYCNEAQVGLRLITSLLSEGTRLLEIGSGLGILSRVLADSGFQTTAIEPSAAGFGFMREMGALIRAPQSGRDRLRWLEIGAAELNPHDHGQFDLVFSTNVLEHISDLDGAFSGMASVLATDGRMIHLCPNYVIPYEPHFAIPLVPLFPRATRFVFPRRVKMYPGVWEELNFITAGCVRSLAKKYGLDVSFDPNIMRKALDRLNDDALYRQRQSGFAVAVQRVVKATRLGDLIGRIPGRFGTPMVMRLSRALPSEKLSAGESDKEGAVSCPVCHSTIRISSDER